LAPPSVRARRRARRNTVPHPPGPSFPDSSIESCHSSGSLRTLHFSKPDGTAFSDAEALITATRLGKSTNTIHNFGPERVEIPGSTNVHWVQRTRINCQRLFPPPICSVMPKVKQVRRKPVRNFHIYHSEWSKYTILRLAFAVTRRRSDAIVLPRAISASEEN
jgi:hypothetical protein